MKTITDNIPNTNRRTNTFPDTSNTQKSKGSDKMANLTPMMQQYVKTKEQYNDCILFYRLGDFYEMFFDDAITASKELEITLTGKDCGLEERAPMCGIPFHAVDSYLNKLVSRGYKVAICEQLEDPKQQLSDVHRLHGRAFRSFRCRYFDRRISGH